jgi:hypothetical protein
MPDTPPTNLGTDRERELRRLLYDYDRLIAGMRRDLDEAIAERDRVDRMLLAERQRRQGARR